MSVCFPAESSYREPEDTRWHVDQGPRRALGTGVHRRVATTSTQTFTCEQVGARHSPFRRAELKTTAHAGAVVNRSAEIVLGRIVARVSPKRPSNLLARRPNAHGLGPGGTV